MKTLAVLLVLLVCMLRAGPVQTKRTAPKPVSPTITKHIEYSAPSDRMGFVVATDTRDRKELWRTRVYTVHANPFLERDVQDVFITSLTLEGHRLLVTNERGEVFALDLTTRKVTKRN